MILRNLNIHGTDGEKTIHIENGKIKSIADSNKDFRVAQNEIQIDFEDAIAFPGFINSHDHLDFNLFPQLGNRIYSNYTEWGKDIHLQNKETVNEVLKVPQQLRIKWGLYKNLLNGITTVVNHGEKLKIEDDLINVIQPVSLHSAQFEKNWKWKLNNPFLKEPVVMHIGEGTDAITKKEIDKVIKWNFLRKKIVAVHGVAMTEKQAERFAGLVWCPASNYFLLNQTADVGILKDRTNIVFGTDSTLTASWNLWDHIRIAKKSGINESELVAMLISKPAKLWGLDETGEIAEKKNADLVVFKKKESFFDLSSGDLLLLLYKGNIRILNKILYNLIPNAQQDIKTFSEINFGKQQYLIQGNFPELIKDIRKLYPRFEPF